MMNDEFLTISQLSAITGLSRHTLRFYERSGLLQDVKRSENGRRRYAVWHVGWLEFVIRLRSTGMPIPDIMRYAELLAEGDSTIQDRLEILEDHQSVIEEQISQLQQNLESIKDKIALYKSMNLAETRRPHKKDSPWRVDFDPDEPRTTVSKLPPTIEGFLNARNFAAGMRYLAEDGHGWDWSSKYRFLQQACIWYRAFPDYAWNSYHIEQQGDIYGFCVEPTGTHTKTLAVAINGERFNVPPTGLALDIIAGYLTIRVKDDCIVELAADFEKDHEYFLLEFIDLATEQEGIET